MVNASLVLIAELYR